AGAERNGERISSGIALPRIVERTGAVQRDFVAPWRLVAVSAVLVEVRIVRIDSVCRANRHQAIPIYIPGESQPRREAAPVRRTNGIANGFWNCGVTRKEESGGSIRVDAALQTLIEPCFVVIQISSAFVCRSLIGLPSQTG